MMGPLHPGSEAGAHVQRMPCGRGVSAPRGARRPRPQRTIALGVAVFTLLLAGCGYRVKFDLPPHLRTFSVNTFRNKTLERNLDFEFTEALIHEICARTRLRVARPGEADLEINGEIDDFDRHVLRRLRYGEKMEMRYLLYVNVEMTDTRTNTTFFQGRRLVERAEFSLNLGETPREGRDAVVRGLARHVVALAFETWPHPDTEAKARAQ